MSVNDASASRITRPSPWVTETARAENVPPSRKLVPAYRSGVCGSPGRSRIVVENG